MIKRFTSLSVFILFFNFSLVLAQEITVEKIWKNYEFVDYGVEGFRSMNDGNYYSKLSSIDGKKGITKHHFVKNKKEIILHPKYLKGIHIENYSFNRDESKILIKTNITPIYRHSYTAIYYLFDLKTKTIKALDEKHSPQTLAEYSPDGKKVSYIHENNLYIKDIASGEITQITNDGKKNEMINGTTDWVYEEEFGFIKAYGWAPDSKHIAYLKFNEKHVKEFTMIYFNDLYPEPYTFKYPKAGDDNSIVTLHLFSLDKNKTQEITLEDYEYIPRLKWSDKDNELIVQTLNRHQNFLKYHLIKITDENQITQGVFYSEKSDTYIDIDDNLRILNDGKHILRTSDKDGFTHIYRLSFTGEQKQITKGEWDVIELLGIDDKNEYIYYTSSENGAINKSLYKITIEGKKKQCIGKKEGYTDASFSNGMKYFIKTYSDANTPPDISLCNNNGKEIKTLEDNSHLKQKLKKYKLSPKEFFTLNGAETPLNAWIIKPLQFDSSKQYPVYINIYGGPGHNTVTNQWGGFNYMYHQLLAQKGYIVVSVDPRGTMYRGRDFKKSTYLQLGKLELEDFIHIAKELGKLPFIDRKRIGIMGWSYGGFMTSLAMTKGADYFKMGIAVAPVTNWRFYDNIYTERFMRTPKENEKGYDDNSPLNHARKLKGKYLLIHGSGDDNVHYQNTMEMIKNLVKYDKQFDLFIYPNKNHGIYGGNTRNHLYKMMLEYTLKNL